MDPIRATNAAALYLTDLHNVFQNWYLAMAAYNAGEFRIMQTIMKAKTRDFWELVEKKALPKETMNYVPKFIAATIIGHNPKKFGFTINRGLNELPELVPISVPSPVRLTTLASKLGIGLSELKSHNPHIRRDLTSVSNRMYEVWVPKEMVPNNLQSRLASLKPIKLNNVAQANGTEAYQVHTVRRGESLGRIANRYRISVAQLKRLNGLKSNTIHAGKSLKVRSSELTRYEVRKGDNLHKIAKKFGLTVNELRKLNRIQAGRSRLYIGQVLKVGNTEG
jgi:membrane-bound lytic murein transglycosylase D